MRPSAHVLLESSHIAEEIPSPDCSRSPSPPWSSSSPTVTDDCCVTFTRLSPDIPIGCSVFFFSEELVGTCSDTSSNNLLKSVHHHYGVRGAVVCRE